MYLDIQTFKAKPGEPAYSKPHMCMRVVAPMQLKFASFHQSKNGMIEPVCQQLHKWKQKNIGVDTIRCDNAGENKGLRARTESAAWKLGIDYEFTARDTPQQNHLAEIAISNINNRGRALLYRAHVPKRHKRKLFREAWLTAVKLDGLEVVTLNHITKTRYEHLFGTNPSFANHLRTWGEAGTVKLKTSTTPKMHTKGTACMFVGYTNDHTGDCYRMWNPITNMVHETRDVLWLNRMYFKCPTYHPEMMTDPLAAVEAGERANALNNTNNPNNNNQQEAEDEDEEKEPFDRNLRH